jgi:hypothetical protein
MAKHKLLPSALGVMLSLIPLQASSEVWLSAIDPYTRQAMKPGDPSDFMALFTPTAPWQQAAGGINVFKTTTQWLLNASDADLTTMFNDLRRRDIALAFEAGMMPQTTTCGGGEGYSQPSDIATLAQRVKRLGGDLKYVAMDEPLWYGHHYQGPNACQLSIPDLAASLVTNFNALRAVFPNVLIGDIEPLSLATVPDWLDELMAFATAYKSTTGAKLDFIDADVQWGEDYLSELQQLTTRVHAAGLKVGIIYNGDATDQTDVAWTTRAEQRFTAIEAESMSREEFLKKAAPAVTFFEVLRDARLPRVIELLNKTNQFNTTGRRWMAAELTNRRIFAF